MESFITNELAAYGPLAVLLLLLLPLGEEIIIISAGVFVGNGHFDFAQTALCAYIGVLISDSIWYGLCYHYGTPILHKRWFKRFAHPRRLLQAKHQIENRGAWVIVTARFVPGSRTPAMITAGMLHLPFWKFALAEGICAMAAVSLQLGLGMLIARGVGSTETATLIMVLVGVAVAVIAVTALGGWIARHWARSHRLPRAKASWLRRFRVRRLHAHPHKAGTIPAHRPS